MRKIVGIAILSMILAMSIVSVSSAPVTIAVLDVKRHITVGEWGAVVFNDTFTILNNGTSSVDEFLYAVRLKA